MPTAKRILFVSARITTHIVEMVVAVVESSSSLWADLARVVVALVASAVAEALVVVASVAEAQAQVGKEL